MTNRFLASALLLLPWAVSADTLILRNGTQLRGTFNSATSNEIGFTDSYGNRQNVNRNDVQELRFGNDAQGQPNDRTTNGSGNTGFGRGNGGTFGNRDAANGSLNGSGNSPNAFPPSGANAGMADDLDRLLQDLQAAIDNNNLPDTQRQSLEDSRATLRSAAQQSRSGRQINQRNVRLALDSIRNATDRMQRQDRDALNEDIRRLGAAVNGTGRDY